MSIAQQLTRILTAKGDIRTALVAEGYDIPENASIELMAKIVESYNHEFVDLGLRSNGKKILFATCNIGAETPYDVGDYFAWGEHSKRYDTNPGSQTFIQDNCPFYDTTNEVYTKYNDTDGKMELDLEDDIAHILWGGNWRMPTQSEMEFLASANVSVTTLVLTSGLRSYMVSGHGDYAGKAISFVESGYCKDGGKVESIYDTAVFATRELASYLKSKCKTVTMGYRYYDVMFSTGENARSNGIPVRPVLEIPE